MTLFLDRGTSPGRSGLDTGADDEAGPAEVKPLRRHHGYHGQRKRRKFKFSGKRRNNPPIVCGCGCSEVIENPTKNQKFKDNNHRQRYYDRKH